jgi:phage terminase small subunit
MSMASGRLLQESAPNEAVEDHMKGELHMHRGHNLTGPEPRPTTLTAKQARFVEEYLIDLNASGAARRAGYSKTCAGEQGYENLKKPEIAAAIADARAKLSERCRVTLDTAQRLASFCDDDEQNDEENNDQRRHQHGKRREEKNRIPAILVDPVVDENRSRWAVISCQARGGDAACSTRGFRGPMPTRTAPIDSRIALVRMPMTSSVFPNVSLSSGAVTTSSTRRLEITAATTMAAIAPNSNTRFHIRPPLIECAAEDRAVLATPREATRAVPAVRAGARS